VGNLPAGIKATQLTAAFEPYGTVTNLNIPIDTGTGYTKGFAFVTFSTADEAAAALADLTEKGLTFPNPLKKGPRELLSTLAYAEGNRKSKGTMRAREGKSRL
jgi:RNA recognition motif-containing protein